MVSPVPLSKARINLILTVLPVVLLVILGIAVFWILDRITVNVARLQKEIQISVVDTGAGIPSTALSRIFEPYWQVQKTRSGMGLGLFIARTLVEAHEGRMWVESTLGRGTTFYFTLPSVSAADTTPLSGLKAG